MTIKDLHAKFELSVRAYNVCINLGINDLRELESYYLLHGSFISAKNCGTKTNDELADLIKTYSSGEQPPITEDVILSLSAENITVFDTIIQRNFATLSVRAKNALTTLFKGQLPDFSAIQQSSFVTLNPLTLKNVGSITLKEIEQYRIAILASYHSLEDGSLSPVDKLKLISIDLFGFKMEDTNYLRELEQRRFPIISFTSQYLEKLLSLSEVDTFILKNLSGQLVKRYTLDDVAKKFDLTRERIRQRQNQLFQKLENSNVFENLQEYLDYGPIKAEEPIINLSSEIVCNPLRSEVLAVGPIFSSLILGAVFKAEYFCLSKIDKLKRPEMVTRYELYEEHKKIKGVYLINKSIWSKAEVHRILQHLLERYCQRRTEDESLDTNSLSETQMTPQQTNIISALILSEFGIQTVGSAVTLPRNTGKLVYEYAIEALERINKPSHISEILSEILSLHPHFDSNEGALRGSLGNHKSIFIYFGRSSTYGLKIWEKDHKNIKGGTIRSIIEEYLENEIEPKHITEVVNYIKRFRATSYNSVISNLKLDNKSKYRFYSSGHVGLTSKAYNNTVFGIELKSAGEISWEKLVDLVF